MVKVEGNEELQSLAIQRVELKTAGNTPAVALTYYMRLKNGTVHGPCEVSLRSLGSEATQAAIRFVDALEEALADYALGDEAKVVPTGLIQTGKEF